MPTSYKIDKARRLVLSEGSGLLTMPDLLAHQDKLASDPDFSADYSQLYDLTQVTDVEITPNDVRRLAQRSVFLPNARRAVLVSSDVVFGLSRMFEVFRESLGETGIRVFRDRAEALAWLLGQSAASSDLLSTHSS